MDNSVEQKYVQTLKKASDKIKELLAEVNALKEREPIAIIGMGCRFPGGADDPEKFWDILEQGIDAIREIPKDRWDIGQYYDTDPEKPGKTYVRYGGFLNEADKFDAGFFGISPAEAESLDPQQRLLLEVSWEALESAGLNISRLKGSKTGVFIGMCSSDYAQAHLSSGDPNNIDEYCATGVAFSTAAGRLSYFYDFHGPGMIVDTACSSSLVALHLAIQSLQNRESDMAIAGGVSMILTPEPYIAFSKLKALAEDGRCRTFDDAASGYSKGEGCGLVILKRLSDAIRDKDNILAVIKGSAVNQDGESSGLTAPNALSQKEVISKALENAKIFPDDVGYIEAHGTGTRLGDPIEARALGMVFGQRAGQKVLVGSVKTNIGHLEGAAGIASIIKVILALQHESIPASLHFHSPSVHIPWNELPIEVCAKLTSWKRSEKSRIAGISSFGFSGTNAHVILQEAPKSESDIKALKTNTYLMPLSAKDETALKEIADKYRKYLSEDTHPFPLSRGDYLNDVCYTASVGRTHFKHRTAIIGTSKEEILKRLSEEISVRKPNNTGVVFLFTGQGAQYPGMAKRLYDTEPVFAKALNQCAEILKKHDVSLMNLLYGAESSPEMVNQTAHTQPLLFAIEYALFELWRSYGVKPSAVIGHSIGEYVAACVAGVFSLEDGLKLAAIRGKLLQSLPKGGVMAAVFDNVRNISEIIKNRNISVAAVNSPKNVVISGEESAIQEVLAIFSSRKIHHTLLQVSHAFHSHLTEPISDQFHKVISGVRLSEPVLPLISNLTGKQIQASEITKPEYWCHHLRQTVRFYDGVKTLENQGYEIFLEIGPHAVLSGLGKQCLDGKGIWLPSLIRGEDDSRQLLKAIAQLYEYGISIDWQGVYSSSPGKKIMLPSYPFQRKRYWKNPVREIHRETTITQKSDHPILKGACPSRTDMSRKNTIIAELQRIIRSISGIELPDIHLNLFKMGLSSIMLTRLKQSVENDFNVEIRMSQFYEDTDTTDKLADYIDRMMPREEAVQSAECKVQNEDTVNIESSALNLNIVPMHAGIESIMREQIQAMSKLMSQQLEVLKGRPIADVTPAPMPPKAATPALPTAAPPKQEENRHERADFRSMKLVKDELSPQQEKFVREFCERYIRRTRKSKELIDKHRPVFSDWINSLGFRMSLKEIMYPITSHRSQGPRLWDIDGHEYIDMAIGYGVNYFGNNARFVVEAVKKQLRDGFHLGPQFDLTNDVAELICELTGVDRVTFCNTGTEAVMTALRIARTVTGRDKIVLFQGSYHGTFDGILAIPTGHGSFPASPGTPPKMVEDVYVLKYGDPESLEFIKAHGRELAAILTEPVQSRNPSLQPHEFLKQLREITYNSKTALIFDEIITGFRIRQGGAQAFYNIQADIVTYGKVIGGGMPLGIISGKSRFMDAIDGGMWKYGDNSFPAKGVTFFGGTFCKHPLAMAASLAVLKYLKAEGPGLQERVNALTAYFADTINAYFEKENVSLRVRYCASFFKFDSVGDYDPAIQPITTDLMFYLLMEKGVYTWERRICFFSTTHTREDVDKIIRAIRESIEEIRNNGFPFSAMQNAKCKVQNEDTLNFKLCTLNCSSEQRRLYILSQLEGGELPYHLPGGTFIDGKPDIARMNRAFTEIIRRHEILRTGFEVSGDKMIQRVHDTVEFEIAVKEGKESDIDEIAQNFIQPFDLSKPPLMRVCLVKLSENRCLLLLDVHHIAADGISANIIVQEFLKLYQGQPLPPVSAQYREYAAWQENYLKSERFRKQEAFWLNQFADEIPVLNLPTDFPRPVRQQFDGDHVWFSSDAETAKALKSLSQKTGTSMFMLTLAAYYVLLHKLSNQEDIVAGIAADGRGQKMFETAVGMFVNTLPIRQKLTHPNPSQEGNKMLSFSEFLNRMKKDLLNIYDHQEYPFEMLVQKLKLSGNMSRNLLSDVMFNFENADDRIFSIEGLRFSPYDFKPKAAMTDLLLEIIETSGSLNMRMEYCTKLFKRETVERWSVYYRNILKEITTDPNKLLSEIDILPESEKRQVISDFNDTKASYPKGKTISELFEEQARKTPDAVVLIFEHETVTYQQLNERANRIAHDLRERCGIKPDDIVGMLLERTPLMFYAILGILKAGGAYLPINTAYPAERMEYMLTDSRCRVLLTEPQYKDMVSLRELEIIDITPLPLSRGEPAENLIPAAKSHHLAYLIYTSGSTGLPKGCMITHENVVRLMINSKFQYDFNASDVWTMAHSYAFDFSVWEMYGAFLYGGKLLVPDFESVRDVSRFLALIKQHRVTVLNQTPPAFYNLIRAELESGDKTLDQHLRWVIFGGDRLEPAHLREWFQRYSPDEIQLVNMYGITETTVHVTFYRMGYEDLNAPEVSPIGLPIPETTVYILDKFMKPVPIGVVGEMYVGGTGVCRGYLNRPELTAERFVENPFVKGEKLYKSGDLARRLSNGNLQYLGRNDDQIQLRGYRVELGEVEKKILGHPAVEKSLVMAKKAADGHPELVAYLVSRESHKDNLSVSELRGYLNKKLPDYMIPAYFVALDNFPLTSNGKIDRRALPDPLKDDSEMRLGSEYAAPRNEIELTMAAIWEDILGRKHIGIHDDFFALGGDSIKAIQVVSRLNAKNLKTQVRLMFQYPTIAELSQTLSGSERSAEQGMVTGIVPLTAIQTWFFREHGRHKDQFAQAVLLEISTHPQIFRHNVGVSPRAYPCSQGNHRGLPLRYTQKIMNGYLSESLNEAALKKAFEAIQLHHDALRMRYYIENGRIIQENRGSDSAKCNVQSAKSEEEFQQHGAAIAKSLSIAEDSLMKAVLFENRLLIVIHHLVTDGVSWRILIEDIETAYRQALSGKAIVLPEKSDSFKRWAEKIDSYRNSEELLREIPFWQSLESVPVKVIARDHNTDIHQQKDDELMTMMLSEAETDMLLGSVNQIYHTEINDVLLTALARAIKQWHGENKTLISLEGHGREALFNNADISRTVGWFTTLYPVRLELPKSEDIGDQIRYVRESLRNIPNKGFGYGILKYLTDKEYTKELKFDLSPQILFNYLGSFNQTDNSLFTSAEEFTQNTVHPEFEREHDLAVEGMISQGKLRFSIAFSPKQYRRERIENLLKIYADQLNIVISHCAEKQREILSNTGIDAANFKDIYPLSPAQEGILFHHLYQKGSAAYIEQFSFQIHGSLDSKAFEASWNELVRRYDILRSIFVHKHTERPMQIVLKDRKIEFKTQNISSLSKEAQSRHIRNFKELDRSRGFDLGKDMLMRITLFETGQDNYEAVWTHHHILMDGWCLGILIRELFDAYKALKQGSKPVFAPAIPYSRYIFWLENKDKDAAACYWREYLAGYEHPAYIPKGEVRQRLFITQTLVLEVEESVSRLLEKIAAQERVTPNVIFQSLWGVLLGAYNNTHDVVFGATVSGRPADFFGIEQMVGLFLNTIPVRIVSQNNQKFTELLRIRQQNYLESEPFHYASLANIQMLTPLKNDLLDHLMVFENYPFSQELADIAKKSDPGFSIGGIEEFERTNYDLHLEIYPGKKIWVEFNYDISVYSEAQMTKVQDDLSRLLGAVAATPEMTIGELRNLLISQEEKQEQDNFVSSVMQISEEF